MHAAIKAIEYYLPEQVDTNEDLDPEEAARLEEHTGIRRRHVAADNECASDLAAAAANNLFASGACRPGDIDFILLCTQSPDYFLPTTACLLQQRLGIPTGAGALDINLGHSGFTYGLSLTKALIESGQARRMLLITAETYSKYLCPDDRSTRTIFGDGAAATLVEAVENGGPSSGIGPFCFGTDGRGAPNLIVPGGGLRARCAPMQLSMNGAEMFRVTIQMVPRLVGQVLSNAGKEMRDIDLFVFHQPNRYMLEHLRRKLDIPEEKFCTYLENFGNTVSSTIPIALKCAWQEGRLRSGMQLLLAGWGVGYSWAGGLVTWA